MKLYYAPHTCSLASNIALRYCDANFEMVKVNLKTKQTSEGDYYKVNPNGYVPTFVTDQGETISEGNVILQWIAYKYPQKNLFPKPDDKNRFYALELLSFTASEVHKSIGALFHKEQFSEVGLEAAHTKVLKRIAVINEELKGKEFILGDHVSIVDFYLFTVISWTRILKIDISAYPEVLRLLETVANEPAAQKALETDK